VRATVCLTVLAATVGLAWPAATGCSATVGGHGAYAAGPAPAGPSQSAASPGGPTTPTPTPPPAPARYDPGRTRLTCTGRTAVAPRSAPYCYLLPAGFRDVSGQIRLGAGTGNARYVSAVGLAGRDLVVVMVYRPPSDTDLLPADRIGHDLQAVLTSLTASGFVFGSRTPEVSRVDRARAFTFHAASRDGSFQSDLTFVFRGLVEVEVLCQYADRKMAVQRACRRVLRSLQVRTVR
jgi:hypothetical protein